MLVKHISHRRKTTAKKCLGQHNVLGWCFLWLNISIGGGSWLCTFPMELVVFFIFIIKWQHLESVKIFSQLEDC